jgi:beta-galactosidase/beta-glucuronidase
MWYRKEFSSPFAQERTLLHFGAVDWLTTVYVNGKVAGNHTGG